MSFEDRCIGLGADIGQDRGVAVNDTNAGLWYPSNTFINNRQDIMIIECFFFVNAASPTFPLIPKVFSILNQFNGTIHTLSVRQGGQLEFRITSDTGGTAAVGIGGAISNVARWYHALVTPSSINGIFNFYFAETGRGRDAGLHGAYPVFPDDYTLTQASIPNAASLAGMRMNAANPTRFGLMRHYNAAGGGSNSDLNGGVNEFRMWRADPSIDDSNDRNTHINDTNGRFVAGAEFPFLTHCVRLNEQASAAADFIDVGVEGASFDQFAAGTDYFASHAFIDEGPMQIVEFTQAPFLDSGVPENVAQTAVFTQTVDVIIDQGLIPTIQICDFSQSVTPVRVHVINPSQEVQFTQIVIDGLHRVETLTVQTADFTQTVAVLREILGALGGQTVDLSQTVTEILVRNPAIPTQAVDLTQAVSLLVERNVTQPSQIVEFSQTVEATFSMGESRNQTVEFTQSVFSPVQKDQAVSQTVEFIQTVFSPVTRTPAIPTQTVEFTQTVAVATNGFEQLLQTVRLTQNVDLTVIRTISLAQAVNFTQVGSPLNMVINQTVEFSQGLTLLQILAQTVEFTQQVDVGVTRAGQNLSATVNLTQDVTVVKVHNPELSQRVDFSQDIVRTGNIDVEVSQTVAFTQTLGQGTLTEIVSQTVGFGQSVGASIDLETLGPLISDDWKAFSRDAAESIFYRKETQIGRSSIGQRTVGGPIETANIEYAMRRQADHREIETFQGKIKIGDVRWELPKELMGSILPQEGDTIISQDSEGNDETWKVVAVDVATLRTRFRIYGRKTI